MSKKLRLCVTSAILILLASAACQIIQPESPTINSGNAAQLQAAVQITDSNVANELVWSLDGSTIIALHSDGAARLKADTLETVDAFTFDVSTIIYDASPDGKTLAYSDNGSNIFLSDISLTEIACTLYPDAIVSNVDFSPDGKTLLTTSMDEIRVTIWDTTNGADLDTLSGFETAAPVYSAKFGEDAKHVIWISRGKVQLSNIANHTMGAEFGHEDFVISTALSPDGKLLATAAAGTINGEFMPVIYVWDAESGSAIGNLTYPEPFSEVLFSPESSLIVALSGHTLIFWDAASLTQVAEIISEGDSFTTLAFAPDGTAIVTASADGEITLWQVK